MANEKNLNPPLQKGQNISRLGSKNWKTVIKKAYNHIVVCENPLTGIEEEMTYQELLVYKQVKRAADGDLRAAKWLADRVEGKPVEMTKIQNISKKMTDKERQAELARLLKLVSVDAEYKEVEYDKDDQ